MSVGFNKSRGASIYSQKFSYQLGTPGRASSFLNKAIKSEIAMENFIDYVDGLLEEGDDEILFKKKLIGYVNERIDKTIDEDFRVFAFSKQYGKEQSTLGGLENKGEAVVTAFAKGSSEFKDKDEKAPAKSERINMGILFTHINAAVGTSNGLSSEEFYNLVGALRQRHVGENNAITYTARSGDEIRAIVGDDILKKIVDGIKQANPKERDMDAERLSQILGDISDRLCNGDKITKINVSSFYKIVDDTHARIARANPISIDNAVRVSEDIIKKTMDRLNKEVPNLAKELTLEDTQVLFLNRSVITDPHLKKLKRFSPKVNEIISEAVKELNVTGAIKAPMNFNGTVMTLARANSMVIDNYTHKGNLIEDSLRNAELYNNDLFLNEVLTDFQRSACFAYKTDELCKMVTDNIEISKNYDKMDKKSRIVPNLESASTLARDKMIARVNKNFVTQKEEEAKNREQIFAQISDAKMPLALTKTGDKAIKGAYIFKKVFTSAIERILSQLGVYDATVRQKLSKSSYRILTRHCELDRLKVKEDISKASSAFNIDTFLELMGKKLSFKGTADQFKEMFDKAVIDVLKQRGLVQNIVPINLVGENISLSEFNDFKHHRMIKPTVLFQDKPDFTPEGEQENIMSILFNSKIVKQTKAIFEKEISNEEKMKLLKAFSPVIILLSSFKATVDNEAKELLKPLREEIKNLYKNMEKEGLAPFLSSSPKKLANSFARKDIMFNDLLDRKQLNFSRKEINTIVYIGAMLNALGSDPKFLKDYYEKEIKPNEKNYSEAKKSAVSALVYRKISLAEQKQPKYDEIFATRKVLHRSGLDGKTLKDSGVFTKDEMDKNEKVNSYYDMRRWMGKGKDVHSAKLALRPVNYKKIMKKVMDQNVCAIDSYTMGKMSKEYLQREIELKKEFNNFKLKDLLNSPSQVASQKPVEGTGVATIKPEDFAL